MKTQKIKLIGILTLSVAIISLSGCATKKAAWGSLEKGMIMQYSFEPDRQLEYQNDLTFEQEMEVMEQKFTITAETYQMYQMMPLASKSTDLEYVVTLTEMDSKIVTPRGEMNAGVDDIIGESFNLTMNPLGKELEYSGAKDLIYDYGNEEQKSLAADIQAFFPDLPDHPVKEGDSWESKDYITESSGSGTLIMDIVNHNTFEKIEVYNNYECMKINVEFSGTIEGDGKQADMELATTGTIMGTGTWYYAFKEGIFVGQQLDGSGETITEITGAQEMTLPATRKYVMNSMLVHHK